jgi:hypothetical protein
MTSNSKQEISLLKNKEDSSTIDQESILLRLLQDRLISLPSHTQHKFYYNNSLVDDDKVKLEFPSLRQVNNIQPQHISTYLHINNKQTNLSIHCDLKKLLGYGVLHHCIKLIYHNIGIK